MSKWFRVNSFNNTRTIVGESYENGKGEAVFMCKPKIGNDWKVTFINSHIVRKTLYSGKSKNKAKEVLHEFICKEYIK